MVGSCPRRGMQWQDGAAQEVEKWFTALVRFRGLVPSDTGWPSDTASSRPTSPPRGPMTRARAQALHQEVNSILSTYAFDTPLDGVLLHANTLCSIRYIDQDTSHGEHAKEEGAGNDENRSTAPMLELPPQGPELPARCLPDAFQRPGKRIQPELPPRGTGTSAQVPP